MRTPRGFSLVEVVVSVLIVGLLLTAALSAAAAAAAGRQGIADRARAAQLAGELMSEILDKPYGDPTAGDAIGPGSDEPDRLAFDDQDDYHGWSASPPQAADGSAIPGFAGWTRSVEVTYLDPDAPQTAADINDRVKRITVTVERGGMVLARLTAVSTAAFRDVDDEGVLP